MLSLINEDMSFLTKRISFHLHIRIEDLKDSDITKHFNDSFDFIEKYLKKSNVLVHCREGVSRSSTIIIGYLMKFNRSNLLKTIDFVKKKRVQARPNDGFLS